MSELSVIDLQCIQTEKISDQIKIERFLVLDKIVEGLDELYIAPVSVLIRINRQKVEQASKVFVAVLDSELN